MELATVTVPPSLKMPPPEMVAELPLKCGVGDCHRTIDVVEVIEDSAAGDGGGVATECGVGDRHRITRAS